ncbi:unnamed protein product [Ectocarpus fasciculatus]
MGGIWAKLDGARTESRPMAIDIKELIRLEAELKTSRERETSPISLDAKVNILKFFQVQTVKQFQAKYDDLYYELDKMGGLDCLRSIGPVRSKGLLQPKVLDLQDCSEDEKLEQQLDFYLADAELAKPRLDELVTSVARDSSRYEVQCVGVKSRDSTRRKARSFFDGDVRKVADMARVTVICSTPEALKDVYMAVMRLPKQHVLRVKNGFNSDWMPSGYRDVKLNPVVKEHLCEIQLHLREFFALQGGQHAVYEWARELNVTIEMRGQDLFENLCPEVAKEMMRLAGQNWRGTGYCLSDLQVAAGQYDLAEMSLRQELRDAEHEARDFEDHDSKESRRALLIENTARARLAYVLKEQGKYDDAEPLYVRSLAIDEKALGPTHPEVAVDLNNLAELLESQGKYEEAEPLYIRSLAIGEKVYGPDHRDVATALNNLAGLLENQGKYEGAEPLYVRSLAISERVYGPDHPAVATGLNNLAVLLKTQGKHEEAEPLYLRSLAIKEKVYSPDHPAVATGLNNLAGLLESQGNYEGAEPLYVRSLAINEKVYGPDHPAVATGLNNLAVLLEIQGKYKEAEPLYVRSLAIKEKVYGLDHPAVATGLNNLAGLLKTQGKHEEAEPLYVRSLAIKETVYSPDHPAVATGLKNLAGLLESQGKFTEAIPLFERALAIRTERLGENHPDTVRTRNTLEVVRQKVRAQVFL